MTLPSVLEIEAFHRDGVTVLRGILSSDWLERLGEAVAANIKSPGPYGRNHTEEGRPGAYFGDYANWQRFPAFREVCEEGPLGAIAAALMGARQVQLFHEQVLVKEPGTADAMPWHQDLPYYCMDGTQTVSIWVPLDAVGEKVCPICR